MFGRKAKRCRTYEYGLLPPVEGEQEAVAEMRRRNDLWNKLVAVDRDFWDAVNALKGETPLKEALKDPEFKRTFTELDAERAAAVKAAAAASDLYWCNRGDVLAAYDAARRKCTGLHFHAWAESTGRLVVRTSGGWPTDAQSERGQQLRIDPRDHPYRAKHLLTVQIGKQAYLRCPMVVHRPLPPGTIKQAAVQRERVGTKYRWKEILSVELADQEPPQPRGQGTIAIDLGWRRTPDGLRVAYWRDTAGASGEVVLGQDWLKAMDKVDSLRSLRDQHFNAIKVTLRAWCAAAPDVPQWLREETATLPQWRLPARLAALCWQWNAARWPGDEVGFAMLEEWRKRDKHLYEWEANMRDKYLRRRREQYRVFAAWVARTYARVLLEDFNLAAVAKRLAPEQRQALTPEQQAIDEASRHSRMLAAPSVLRLAIENACGREGVQVEKVPAAMTTQWCPVCNEEERFDAAVELRHRCARCGHEWDQDDAASRNLLARAAPV